MIVASPRRFTAGDFPEAPPWFERFMDQLNQTFAPTVQALQGNLTAAENSNSEERELEVRHEESFEVTLTRLRGQVKGLLLLRADYFDFADLAWEPLDARRLRAKVRFATNPGRAVKVRLRAEGG